MNQLNLQNRLAVSNGTVKNGQNKAMQLASQTTESPETAKKRLGLLAVIAVGVDAAASFLKSKMEKAAAVASQVGAAILKSKKAVSSAADAVIGAVQPKSQKIAVNHLAKGKARLASIPILTLLAAFFFANPVATASPRGQWLPEYDYKLYSRLISMGTRFPDGRFITTPFGRTLLPWPFPQPIAYNLLNHFHSKVLSPANIYPPRKEDYARVIDTYYDRSGTMTEQEMTIYSDSSTATSTHQLLTKNGWKRSTYAGGLDIVYHTNIGKRTTKNIPAPFPGGVWKPRPRRAPVWCRDDRKTEEEWKTWLIFPSTSRMEGGPFSFYVRFTAWNDFLPLNSTNRYGWTSPDAAPQLVAYPNHNYTLYTPHTPANMSMPSNGYLAYSYWTELVRSDDNEEEN